MVQMDIYQLYYVAYIIDISFRQTPHQKLFRGALIKASKSTEMTDFRPFSAFGGSPEGFR